MLSQIACGHGFPYFEGHGRLPYPDQNGFVRRAIETGPFHPQGEAVEDTLALWEGREQQRAEFLLTLSDSRASAFPWANAA